MSYRLATDGDVDEAQAAAEFLDVEFPEYEKFWIDSVVPLTNRPDNIHFKNDRALPAGRNVEDIAVAQLHYTVLKQLRRVFHLRSLDSTDDYILSLVLSFLVAAQDVAFELLERSRNRGRYDPWKEGRTKGTSDSGQDARDAWKRTEGYPLQWVRDYRNKLLHGRTPPALAGNLPRPTRLDAYADWRRAALPNASQDFEDPRAIADQAWRDTLAYFRTAWKSYLL